MSCPRKGGQIQLRRSARSDPPPTSACVRLQLTCAMLASVIATSLTVRLANGFPSGAVVLCASFMARSATSTCFARGGGVGAVSYAGGAGSGAAIAAGGWAFLMVGSVKSASLKVRAE